VGLVPHAEHCCWLAVFRVSQTVQVHVDTQAMVALESRANHILHRAKGTDEDIAGVGEEVR